MQQWRPLRRSPSLSRLLFRSSAIAARAAGFGLGGTTAFAVPAPNPKATMTTSTTPYFTHLTLTRSSTHWQLNQIRFSHKHRHM
jgi:hypothetical protein